MAKQNTGTEIKTDEFSKIFDEYRAKIEEITRRTEKSLHAADTVPAAGNGSEETEQIEVISASDRSEDAAPVDAVPVDGAPENSQPQPDMVPPSQTEPATPENENADAPVPPPDAAVEPPPAPRQPEAANTTPPPAPETRPQAAESPSPVRQEPPSRPEEVETRSGHEHPVFKESAEILYEARREAKRIIEEAEESARKEAKKRTQSQVDKIIEKAKKEAADIVGRANREAEKTRDAVIAESKREADAIIGEITEKYRQETQSQSSRAMTDAQEKAGKMLADVSLSTQQVSKFITEIVAKAKRTINEMETDLQAEVAELSRIVTETQGRLETTGNTVKEEKPAPAPPRPVVIADSRPTLSVRLIGEMTQGKNGNGALFSGQMEMKSISELFDYQYLKRLKKYLVHIPNIKYLQEYASEKEMSVVFDVLEPMPMLDILNKIPMVNEVITRADDDICLVFKESD